jgi:hypothetical protein
MEKEQRNRLQKATQDARRLLEEEFAGQLLQTYDINVAAGRWNEEPGAHLQAEQRLIREKLVAWIEHRSAQINDEKEALLLALREMAFTALNRFVALKLMEARELVRPCVSGGLESEGFQEFTAVAQGLLVEQESSYRLYLETIFEDVSRELQALFDPRDPASLLWPKRTALLDLLDILNRPELAELWREDETLGWIYQYFNGNDVKEMRDAAKGGAPRNSRELAVRNQFFTPRYVVEFLTDNTLGRIWYEMRQGDTNLKERCHYLVRRPNEIWLQPGEEAPAEVVTDESLNQEELLRHPVHIPYRPLKDPREICMLDPACGSMHFGLYAFDLYLAIYEEAWEIAQGSDEQAKQGEAFAPFVAYAADFASKAAFLREMPRLILQHNIHGVDIDPRATQIARLTLWLRAQRAWQDQGVEVADRLAISRSNVVCAEPMPGERELLADFVDQQFPEAERGLVQQLLETIFDKMQLAGEAGSLLKIEEEIRDAIEQARREWQKLAIQQRDLFSTAELASLGQAGALLNSDLQNLTKDFWINIEERVYTALNDFAEQAESGTGFKHRLFAEDAAQGFAFIDLCRKRYDAVVMNPPYGSATEATDGWIRKEYPESCNDLYAAFSQRAFEMTEDIHGSVGAITSKTFLYSKRLREFRKALAKPQHQLDLLIDFGLGVLDAMVETAAWVSRAYPPKQATFWDWTREDKASLNSNALALLLDKESLPPILAPLEQFQVLPFGLFSYWCPTQVLKAVSQLRTFEPTFGESVKGLTTFDDFRFIRLMWEVPYDENKGRDYRYIAKGGGWSRYHSESTVLMDWRYNGELPRQNELKNYGTDARSRQSISFWLRPGLTFSEVSSLGFSVQPQQKGNLFGGSGFCIFPRETKELPFWLAFFNSKPVFSLMAMFSTDRHWNSEMVARLPIPEFGASKEQLLALGNEQYVLARADAERSETAAEFVRCIEPAEALRSDAFGKRQAEIDAIVTSAYGFSSASIEILEQKYGLPHHRSETANHPSVGDLLSYALGTVFGRWDIRFALSDELLSDELLPELPGPFAPLPVCPPGMFLSHEGLPGESKDMPANYPLRISWQGILVDDQGQSDDVVTRAREAMEVIWKERAKVVEQQVCESFDSHSLRDSLCRPAAFFASHIKRYSKSRRQAPIYWQLSAGNGTYSVWLYYHRFTQDTFYRVLRDFVEPRIQQAEREQFELESQGALSGDAAIRLQEAQSLLKDLRLFKSELELVAPLWNPNLNDGVIINHAILWRITSYTPWQKKCKECWDKLVKGDYDWAHLAFHLWPDRVIRKCTTDRSLAIAHGLEERLWQETNNENWLQRQVSEAELQALIAEHSKPAVQNALERFLAAPPPVAAARTRAPRAAKSSSTGTTRKPRGSAPAVDAEASRQTLLVLTAAPAEGLGRNAIADLLDVEAASLTAVIKQLKESGQIEQLGAARGAKYRLTEQGRAAVEGQAGEDD